MIKFKAFHAKKERFFVGLGLSDENVRRLINKQPIYIDGTEMGCDHDILIMYGKTEKLMYEDLKDLIGPETELRGF